MLLPVGASPGAGRMIEPRFRCPGLARLDAIARVPGRRHVRGCDRRAGKTAAQLGVTLPSARPRASHEVVEKWPAGLVGRDHLSVHNGIVDVELGRNLLAERVEAAQGVAVP